MRPARHRSLLAITIPLLAFAACGGDDPVVVDDPMAQFVGDWTGISMVFTPTGGGGSAIDLILVGGALDLNITADGRFTMALVNPLSGPESRGGTFSVSGNTATLQFDNGDPQLASSFVFSQAGERLTLSATSGVALDFNFDGTPDPATLNMVLQKKK